ncbi:multifunctional oxoglutarate decarboxylase/oxoglutarate dehydrogenase thiamine pyrophosphate-binding subunit/dihydrolipoyllysine-residue succinyltransferase subunit [Jatrophihabitans endophyticus]|uniref:multifunctional oxoglutarate decarboxylase/oxoglutarate dehydrogenase thiamine pyrophosphate-binding subunit/dihydrolipoyllysine-residue succinyltransferase subunit n=1 Tax=Jatrophihabitans endophyticus TaxID=1206085 RepID=UPI0026F25609|nr:multifunctional oxoglutarate decarboxylase/oxoglutarate dehydrogenase thiamine pyrophosphate-binding subunit/dihydrolipoyllysine-residue succinyltransferase subunit [Jatrophihabitans endophyticus]
MTSDNPTNHGDFGANEWLVEDMYERYLADPNSVDAAWHDFFDDYKPGANGSSSANGSSPHDADDTDDTDDADDADGADTTAPQAAAPQATTGQAARPAPTPAPAPATTPAQSGSTPERTPEKRAATVTTAPTTTSSKPPTPAATRREGLPPESPAAENVRTTLVGAADDSPIAEPGRSTLRGAAARVVSNMEQSLTVPTATSVRAVPAKLLADNRVVINNHLRRSRGGKISFTHVIGFAVVRALRANPEMNNYFAEVDGKPAVVTPEHVNLGVAIDLAGKNGARSLVVASIKAAETMDFAEFWNAYEDIIRRARGAKLTTDDFAGTTISLTNPGTIGTNHSVPRLMAGQGTIVGVGAMEYPAEFSGMSPESLTERAVSKIMTLTSTYDHRIIQGAQSGEFLRRVHELLLADDFYDEIFAALRIPYEPVRWLVDRDFTHEGQIGKNARVIELINSYRTNGHLMADTDPLEFTVRSHPDLDITRHGLTLWDLDREFPVDGFAGEKLMRLRDILGVLRDAYCRRVGVEYMHITDPEQRRWIQQRIEVKSDQPTRDEQLHILGRLNVAEAFETFLQTKYVGQKRFSLEGAETVIALLDAVLGEAADESLDEVVVGMPHRGRLNVLANIIGKPYSKIFNEFEGNIDPDTAQGSGDVKYHLGADGTFHAASGNEIAVSLTANPSHLEAVDPVLEGIVRAKQDQLDKGDGGYTVLPVMMHGDAAFAGQGVVAETLNLSQLRGYRTGGTVHVIVNNQVGFTTSPSSSRSSLYCTDIARMIAAPIFHVNGDDPEACVRVAKLAVEYRREFRKDVVIDMVCYRRRGHNEADNPSFTQPLMYDIIDSKRSVRKLYTEALVGRGDITLEDAEAALKDFQSQLEKVFVETRNTSDKAAPQREIERETPSQHVTTSIPLDAIKRMAEAYANPPAGFTLHPRLKPQIDRRIAMASSGNVDWATAELFAFGSLVMQGRTVRLSGQDSRRGTFTQRHATLIDRETGDEYTPLQHLAADGDDSDARFMAYDSLLSEYAAMGFEYGYSVVRADALVCWEAQFGDFFNGAQTIIDEFISSGEAKWGQRSAVTLLLPHGQEGQGPDHSSGRPERFLQLAAENNMTVAMCSSPANYFHLLRRQGLSPVRRPLIAFTPKSLLRLKAAVSQLDDFTDGTFMPVLPDPSADASKVTRVLLCAGKVYYDLAAEREKSGRDDVAILRVEQLYPLPVDELRDELATFPGAELVWVQEEPANQGGWPFMALNLPEHLDGRALRLASRRASASPAVGSASVAEKQQREVVATAFA